MRSIALALVLAGSVLLTGCPKMCKDMPMQLTQFGTPPPDIDKVLVAAEKVCGFPIVGEIHWLDNIPTCGGFPPTPPWKFAGCQNGDCGLNADVLYLPEGTHHNSIYRTALAHEICHWCWPEYSEAQADECSAKIHAVAQGV
jgi:hypothetical protein